MKKKIYQKLLVWSFRTLEQQFCELKEINRNWPSQTLKDRRLKNQKKQLLSVGHYHTDNTWVIRAPEGGGERKIEQNNYLERKC